MNYFAYFIIVVGLIQLYGVLTKNDSPIFTFFMKRRHRDSYISRVVSAIVLIGAGVLILTGVI